MVLPNRHRRCSHTRVRVMSTPTPIVPFRLSLPTRPYLRWIVWLPRCSLTSSSMPHVSMYTSHLSSTAFSKVLGMIFFWLFFTLVTFVADACDSAYGRAPYSYSTLRRCRHDIKTISLVHLQERSPRVTPTHDQ